MVVVMTCWCWQLKPPAFPPLYEISLCCHLSREEQDVVAAASNKDEGQGNLPSNGVDNESAGMVPLEKSRVYSQ